MHAVREDAGLPERGVRGVSLFRRYASPVGALKPEGLDRFSCQERLFSNEELLAHTALEAWLAERYRDTRIFGRSEVYGVLKSHLRYACGNDLGVLLSDALAYARSLIDDGDAREEALENAARWTAGKPKDLISEYKMFGD